MVRFFVAAGQSAFVNELIIALPSHAPGIDSATVIATGATGIRTAFSADVVPGIVQSYMAGIKVALALPLVVQDSGFWSVFLAAGKEST